MTKLTKTQLSEIARLKKQVTSSKKTVGQLCKERGIPDHVLLWRAGKGWAPGYLCKAAKLIEWKGVKYTVEMLADLVGCYPNSIRHFVRNGVYNPEKRGKSKRRSSPKYTAKSETAAIRAKVVEESRQELNSLMKHHRKLSEEFFAKAAIEEDEIYDNCEDIYLRMCIKNARMLEASARKTEIRQYDYMSVA